MSPTYDFGGPLDYLVDIHFPTQDRRKTPPDIVGPWFWYLTRQTPSFFVYLGGGWGQGWEFRQLLPIIKILPIDTQVEVPTSEVGFGSIEEAIDRTNAGQPISQDAWGRFYFNGPQADKFWWKVGGKAKPPEYKMTKGCPTQLRDPKTGLPIGEPLADVFQTAVHHWRDCWNNGATTHDSAAAGVSGDGTYTCVLPFNGGFGVPGPRPDEPIPELSKRLGVDQYFGAIPSTEIFSSGQAHIFKQAWAFTMQVAQLDAAEWDFTHFPPKRTSLLQFDGGSGRPPFSISHDASANNPSIIAGILPPFPQNSPHLL
jgi:hypothetical protein